MNEINKSKKSINRKPKDHRLNTYKKENVSGKQAGTPVRKRPINPEKRKFPYNQEQVEEKKQEKQANSAPRKSGVKQTAPKPKQSNQKQPMPKTTTKKKRKKKRKLSRQEVILREKKRRKAMIIEVAKFIIPVLLVAVFVFFFILKTSPHMVDGDSMKPTLLDKDKVIIYQTKDPKRYDVITFKPPVKSDYLYVKRVIGMPGDKIWVQDNYLYINQQEDVLPENVTAIEDLPDGTIKVNISEESVNQLLDKNEIPEGYYFVLGDNRTNSSDSREFGLIHKTSIEGTVVVRFSPFNRISFIN